MRACQIATQAGHFRPEGAHRHGSRRTSRALSYHRKQQRLNHLMSWALWFGPHSGPDLQQAYGKRGQQTQQADQALDRLQLSFFNAPATFEALVRVFDQPALSIPGYALPCLLERRGSDRSRA
jgi:hypothetical protein